MDRRRTNCYRQRICCGAEIGLLLIVCFGVAPGCKGVSPDTVADYGTAYNAERQRRGIPILPDGWVPQVVGREVTYLPPKSPDASQPVKYPRHQLKKLIFSDDMLVLRKESDTYHSAQRYYNSTEGTSPRQVVFLTYSYEDERAGLDPWHCSAYLDASGGATSIDEAMAILREWGLAE